MVPSRCLRSGSGQTTKSRALQKRPMFPFEQTNVLGLGSARSCPSSQLLGCYSASIIHRSSISCRSRDPGQAVERLARGVKRQLVAQKAVRRTYDGLVKEHPWCKGGLIAEPQAESSLKRTDYCPRRISRKFPLSGPGGAMVGSI
jgi:hypothetical protein